MVQSQLNKNLESFVHEGIKKILAKEDVTPYVTPLKNSDQVKNEIEQRFITLIQGMSKSLERAERLIHLDLLLVATPEEVERVENEIAVMGDHFFNQIESHNDVIERAASSNDKSVDPALSLQDMLGLSDKTLILIYKLAMHYREEHDYAKAKDLLNLLLNVNGRISTYWVAMGSCCHSEHKHEEAIAYYNGGAEVNSLNPAPYFYAASCYIDMKHFGEAKEKFAFAQKLVAALPSKDQSYWGPWITYLKGKLKI